jgi:hypothetical protein
MDDALVLQLDRSIREATRSLSAFWRKDEKDFLRDTEEARRSPSEPYYPTATFICISALQEEPAPASSEVYKWEEFLGTLEARGLSKVIGESDIVATAGVSWNVYTSACAVICLCSVRAALAGSTALTPAVVQKTLAWLDKSIVDERTCITTHLAKHGGARLDDRGPVHPFLTLRALTAITGPSGTPGGASPVDIGLLDRILEHSVGEIHRIVSASAVGECSSADLVALAFHAAIVDRHATVKHPKLVAHCLELVCRAYATSGGWPLGRTLIYSAGGHGAQISPHDLASDLVETAIGQIEAGNISESALGDMDTTFANIFHSLRGSIVESRTPLAAQGWCNDHAYGRSVVESWTTALALRYFKRFRRYAQLRLNQKILGGLDTRWPSQMSDWVSWEDLTEPDRENPILEYIRTFFIEPIHDRGELPDKGNDSVSMLLFGPPGTAKTTLIRALAKQLGWPLLTVTPSLFLGDGVDGIDAKAAEFFSRVTTLERVVVFFDECDELFRQRPEKSEGEGLSAAALITGAMLPRLQDLHDRGRLVFVLATNRLRAIDRAVLRHGRIDHVIGVGPPCEHAREDLLRLKAPGIQDSFLKPLAQQMKAFTRDEVIRTGKELGRYCQSQPGLTVNQASEKLGQLMPPKAQTISEAEMLVFEEDRKLWSSPAKHKIWMEA